MPNPYQVVRDFENAVADYTNAPFCVTVNSCTSALFLCLKWFLQHDWKERREIEIPKRTYISVPMSILHAGGRVAWRDEEWRGSYQLKPYPVFDAARRFTSGMYTGGSYSCVSFHASKTLGIEQGGAILTDDRAADRWFRMARFDGRNEGVTVKDDKIEMLGYHCYMSPSVAAQGLLKLYSLPKDNPDLPNDDYPDLSTFDIFK